MKKAILLFGAFILLLDFALISTSCKQTNTPAKPNFVNFWETNVATSTPTPTPCLVGGTPCTSTPVPTSACTFTPIADITSKFIGALVTPTPIVGDTSWSTNDFYATGSGCYGTSSSKDDLYMFRLSAPTDIIASTCGGANWDTVLYLSTGCGNGYVTQIACNDQDYSCTYSVNQSTITAALPAGQYFLFVDGYYGSSGPYTLLVTHVP